MSLSSGSRLGPYEVIAPLGAGGMGEVYRARDTRLSREVAIKVLSAELAGDPSRLKRFEKEARAASALNHPNIVTIYDIGSADSTFYIAMERVEGSTLRELLVGGPLAVKKLLQVATQIADGLARAHEAGIVHRDLKPENVMVTKDGLVKILDFGLAKLTKASSGSGEGSQLATETRSSPGVVVGTASYMSPEQASGEEVDFRSDQFSFGSILYEMSAGKRAFSRKTGVDTLAAILNEDPEPIAAINPQSPAPLRWIVERCLAKEPEARYLSTGDLARDLSSLREHVSELSSGTRIAIEKPRRRPKWRTALVAGLGLLAGASVALVALRRPAPELPRYHRLTFHHGGVGGARFSPDGQTIVYAADWTGHQANQLFSTRPDATESTGLALPSADIFSIASSGTMLIGLQPHPDASGGGPLTVAEVPLAGGAPRPLLEGVQEADLSPDGHSVTIVRRVEDRYRLECPIGKVLEEKSNGYFSYVRSSPDGQSLAMIEGLGAGAPGVDEILVLRDRITGTKRILTTGWQYTLGIAWNPRTGEIWFSSREALGGSGTVALHAVSPSGAHRIVARGPENLIIKDISRDGRVLLSRGDFSQIAICRPPGAAKEVDLSWHDLSEIADLSDDGRAVLLNDLAIAGGSVETVYIRATDGSPAVRLGEGFGRALSPDGKWALVTSVRLDRLTILPTGAGQPRVLPGERMVYGDARFFPDGKRVLFAASTGGRPARLWVQDVGAGQPRVLTPEGYQIGPVSPDGKWIATRTPGADLVLFPVDGGEPRPVRGATSGDSVIRFDATGETLFLRTDTVPTHVTRLDLSTGGRVPWKEIGPADIAGVPGVGVSLTPDGKSYAYWSSRFLETLFLVDGLK